MRSTAAPVSHLQATAPPVHRTTPQGNPRRRPHAGHDQAAGHPEHLDPPRPHWRRGQRRCRVAGEAGGQDATTNPAPLPLPQWEVPAGKNPTHYAPDHEPYDTVPRGSPTLCGEQASTWHLTTMNLANYRAFTFALSIRLPFAFGWLVGGPKWAMGLARNPHGHECRDLFFRSGGLRPDAVDSVIASWLTWRQIPVTEWLRPLVGRAHQPPVPPPQPGAYGNAAVAQAAQKDEAPANYWSSSSTPSRPGESDPSTIPCRDRHPRYPSSSSDFIRTQPRPRSTAGAAGALLSSRAEPPSPRQARAAKRAARRYLSMPQHRPDSTSAQPQGATNGDRGDPAPSTENGITQNRATAAVQPAASARHGAGNPQPAAISSPTRQQAPCDHAPAHGRHYPLNPSQTGADTYPHNHSPAQPTAPIRPINHPAPCPASTRTPTHAPHTGAPTRTQRRGPQPRYHNNKDQHWPKPW